MLKLKQKCFSRLSFAEKKVLVENSRPCPDLDILTTVKIKKTGVDNTSCTRHFRYDDLNHLNTAVKKHTESEIHIAAYFKLKTFLSSSTARIDISLDKQRKIDIQLHNEKAAKNREILKRLINAVCFLAKQELPFRGHNENKYSVNRGNYMELLISSQEFDPLLQEHLNTSTIFRGTSVSTQNDLLNSVADVIKHEIFNAIQNTQYVAIMLDETTDISNKSQLSTVLRYFSQNENKIVERFLGFDDMSADKTAASLFNHLNQVVDKFKIESKLVAQTYDGAAVMSGHLNGLQSKVLEKYPKAMFTHCYAHVINVILQQSLECNKELKIFFRGLNSLPVFFSHSPKRLKALSEFMTKKLATLATTRWNFTSRLVHTVHNHRTSLVDFFMFVYESDNFPSNLLKNLQDIYGDFFNYGKLQNELHVWYTLNESSDKSPIEIMNYLSEMSLISGFSEVYKLAQLISTIPTTTASVERSFSSLKRIILSFNSNSRKDEQLKHNIDRKRIGFQIKSK
ncbi:zinc finger MYM-type protein 1-like [Myzus persicae]|uniref:zinc finger MYM-type protein 1-like n=1 Tax=Myzus persicae TaxID=13164 RepID=UPI000B930C22|nr:zinc finger MYM-type protein 1-like [Myzus persicae]